MVHARHVGAADEAWHGAGKLEKEVNSAGGESKLKHYVFTHVHFDIAYNGNRIVVSLLLGSLWPSRTSQHSTRTIERCNVLKTTIPSPLSFCIMLKSLPALQEINVSTDPAQMVTHPR